MSTEPVAARAPAKINLSLHVGPRRSDGFHEIATVYQAVDLYDEVSAEGRSDGVVSVETRDPAGRHLAGVPGDDTHLAARAALALRTAAGVRAGVHLRVHKAIPVAGGMAGGSADAAASLLACAELWGLGAEPAQLLGLAARIGSDVPFALLGGTALGTGRGERVEPLPAGPPTTWVLVAGDTGLSTPAVYAESDRLQASRAGEPEPTQVGAALLRALRAGDLDDLGAALHNDLQAAALALRPELADVLACGDRFGALGAIVSGSGPTVLLLVADDAQAAAVADRVGSVAGQLLPGVRLRTAHGPAPGAHLVPPR